MSAPLPRPTIPSPPDAPVEERPLEREQRKLAPGILSRRLLRQDDLSPVSWWQRWWMGYLLTILFIALTSLVGGQFLSFVNLEPHFFAGALMILLVFIIALVWGAGPAIFATILSTLVLDYSLVSRVSTLGIINDLIDFLPFVAAGLIVSVLASQRERARLRARTAERLSTERARELEEAGKMKDQFLSLASHELKTPISAIKGYAQLAERRLGKAPINSPEVASVQEVLTRINQQTDKLTILINDLLDVSRIQAGKLELRLEMCNLAALCRQAAEEQELTSGRHIDTALPAEPIFISADAERLSQVLSNLLTNALKYSAIDSPVCLMLSRAKKEALITVKDEGVGIPQDELPFIFDRFFRASTARNGSQRGLGLGLAICKEIVERHHGRIWATSKEGKGSQFMVALPLEEQPSTERTV